MTVEVDNFVIGIDFGTDSVRSVIVNSENGEMVSSSVFYYPRWNKGLHCEPIKNQFRQHPLDYLDGLENTIKKAIKEAPAGIGQNIRGISVDTTGSTPVAVDQQGTPLALLPEFQDNPNAMFVLWKDHTALKEVDEINQLSKTWGGVDYTKYVGGLYSSEWFWSKILHILRKDEQIRNAAYSWVEHCDWIPYLLTGERNVRRMKRSRCAAGHKAMWHPEFKGLPGEEFLTKLDPLLKGLRAQLYDETYTSDKSAGKLSKLWSDKLGLSEDVVIGIGAFDAHMGAVGAEIEPFYLTKVMGTSTCDVLIAPSDELNNKVIKGICGQVDGSVIPGMIGLEAGQSAFGDIYSWFSQVLSWPLRNVLYNSKRINPEDKEALLNEVIDEIIPSLSKVAEKISIHDTDPVALDWFNGRRTPDANQGLKGTLSGLTLGSDAPVIFKSLVQATCFGARKIVEQFNSEGIKIDGIIALGGITKKSPYVMQTLADVLNQPIKIAKCEQTCALGAAMFAATAAGLYDQIDDAKEKMGNGFEKTYFPRPENVSTYNKLYTKYNALGDFIENDFSGSETKFDSFKKPMNIDY